VTEHDAQTPDRQRLDVTQLRNVPIQARSHTRADLLRAAAEAHLDDVGRDRFTTAPVARIAGSAIGTLYRYFPDRVALLDAISPNPERQIADIRKAVHDESLDPAEALKVIAVILDQRTENEVRDARG